VEGAKKLIAKARGIILGIAPQMFREDAKLIPGVADPTLYEGGIIYSYPL
jgi:hypothetical protein